MMPTFPVLGTLTVNRKDGSSTTAFTQLIPPYRSEALLASGIIAPGFAHIRKVCYTTAGTAHTIGIMRPFNYTTFTADAAASQAVVNIAADPGLYSTAANWKYAPFPGGTPRVANNAIAANDWVVYQAADGTWVADTVSSVATLAITLTTNLPTGGVKNGGLFYFFGVIGDSDPNTGAVNPQTKIAASQTRDTTWSDTELGIVAALHRGDPLLFYSPDNGADGSLEYISGIYAGL